jgi:hypothetical protein
LRKNFQENGFDGLEFRAAEFGNRKPHIDIQASFNITEPVVLTRLLGLLNDAPPLYHLGFETLLIQRTFQKRDMMDDGATHVVNLDAHSRLSRDFLHVLPLGTFYFLI